MLFALFDAHQKLRLPSGKFEVQSYTGDYVVETLQAGLSRRAQLGSGNDHNSRYLYWLASGHLQFANRQVQYSPNHVGSSPAACRMSREQSFDVEWISPGKLKPYPKNPKKRSAQAIEKIWNSIRESGWRQPIVVDEKMIVVIGHGRLAAALAHGVAKVPIHIMRGVAPAKIRALRIADNRTHEEAEWDNDLLRDELLDLVKVDFDLEFTGMDKIELARLDIPGFDQPPAAALSAQATFAIMIDCKSEVEQTKLLEQFLKKGLKCRALMS